MSYRYWQTRDAVSGEYRDVQDRDISVVRERASEIARTATHIRMQQSPELDRQSVFVEAFKQALAGEIAALKA
ncbi:MAG: hypothetical protein AB7V46_12410 [Thermomicrobiales bacterium]